MGLLCSHAPHNFPFQYCPCRNGSQPAGYYNNGGYNNGGYYNYPPPNYGSPPPGYNYWPPGSGFPQGNDTSQTGGYGYQPWQSPGNGGPPPTGNGSQPGNYYNGGQSSPGYSTPPPGNGSQSGGYYFYGDQSPGYCRPLPSLDFNSCANATNNPGACSSAAGCQWQASCIDVSALRLLYCWR